MPCASPPWRSPPSRTGWPSASSLALTNAVIVLLALALFWQAGDPAEALADYTQSALAAYEVIF
nr:hypothetical protein [uncultured Bilophila sp.]